MESLDTAEVSSTKLNLFNHKVNYLFKLKYRNLIHFIDPSKFYVNPNSTSNLELGTIDHPFRMLDDAFREMFNYGS